MILVLGTFFINFPILYLIVFVKFWWFLLCGFVVQELEEVEGLEELEKEISKRIKSYNRIPK